MPNLTAIPLTKKIRSLSRRVKHRLAAIDRNKTAKLVLELVAVNLPFMVLPAHAADVNALPTGGQVTAGSATLSEVGNTLNIQQATQKAALSWQSFNVGANATVNFIQPNSQSIALNHILGNSASEIYGHLNANGQVFFQNANGMLFARGSQVNVGGLLATTMNISDQDFMAGNMRFTNPGQGSIINQGLINASGSVVFLANDIRNETNTAGDANGIFATTITLAAGNKVAVDLTGDGLIRARIDDASLKANIDNSGNLTAAQVTLSALQAQGALNRVVNNSGVIRATGISTIDGQISLDGGSLQNTGTLIARNANGSGGTIKLLGDMSNGQLVVGGRLDASAGVSGNGGFIETSAAHVKILDDAHVSTYASHGRIGTWLIDPFDYIIASSGGDITGAALSTNLATTNVSIVTGVNGQGSTGVNGDIYVNDAISWSSGTTLSLDAFRNINVNANITASGGGGIHLLAHGDLTQAIGTSISNITNTANVNDINLSGVNVTLRNVRSQRDVILTATGNLNLLGQGNGNLIDDTFFLYTLPFNFTYFGTTYTQAYITTNGLITFGAGTASYTDSQSGLSSYKAIAPAWNDWTIQSGTGKDIHIRASTSDLTVRWDVARCCSNIATTPGIASAQFEAVLNSNGMIRFDYGTANNSFAGDVTIGLSNGSANSTIISQLMNEANFSLNNLKSTTFTPNGSSYTETVSASNTPLTRAGVVSGLDLLDQVGRGEVISALNGTLRITAGGSIDAPAQISAQVLEFTSHGGASFTGSNHIGAINASQNLSSGDFTFLNTSSPLTINGLINDVGNIGIDNTGGIEVAGTVRAGTTVDMTAHSPITILSTGSVTAGGNLTLTALSTSSTATTDLLTIAGSLFSSGGNLTLGGGSGVSFAATASVSAPSGSIAATSLFGPVTADPLARLFALNGITLSSFGGLPVDFQPIDIPTSPADIPASDAITNILTSITSSATQDDRYKLAVTTPLYSGYNTSELWKDGEKESPVNYEKLKGKSLQCGAK